MAKIALFAGHGGADPGAVSGSRHEKTYTLAIALKAAELLRAAGHDVVLNRTTDVSRSINNNVAVANQFGAELAVDIHLNANVGTPGTGVEVYHGITDEFGKKVALQIHNNIVFLGFRGRGIKTKLITTGASAGLDYFGTIRLTNMPAVLVETAFINNSADMTLFDSNKMAEAIVNGILESFPAIAIKEPAVSDAPLYRVFEQVGAYSVRENALAHRAKLTNRSILIVD